MKVHALLLTSLSLLALGCNPQVQSGAMSSTPASGSSPATSSEDGGTGTTEQPVAADNGPEANHDVKVKILSYDQIQELVKSHAGKVVVMDAWSLSCEPCIKEFPHLVELHQKYGQDRVACVSLSFDYEGLGKPEEVVPQVLEFLLKHKATFDNVVSNEESDALYKKFELASVPAVYVYDAQGQLKKRFDNESITDPKQAFTYKDVESLVSQLLAEPNSAKAN